MISSWLSANIRLTKSSTSSIFLGFQLVNSPKISGLVIASSFYVSYKANPYCEFFCCFNLLFASIRSSKELIDKQDLVAVLDFDLF